MSFQLFFINSAKFIEARNVPDSVLGTEDSALHFFEFIISGRMAERGAELEGDGAKFKSGLNLTDVMSLYPKGEEQVPEESKARGEFTLFQE